MLAVLNLFFFLSLFEKCVRMDSVKYTSEWQSLNKVSACREILFQESRLNRVALIQASPAFLSTLTISVYLFV